MDTPLSSIDCEGLVPRTLRLETISLYSSSFNRGPDVCPLTSEVTIQYIFRVLGDRRTISPRLVANFLEV